MATGNAASACATDTAMALPWRTVENAVEHAATALLARQLDDRVLPDLGAERQPRRVIEQPPVQPRRQHDERLPRATPRERAHVLRVGAVHREAAVVAVTEQLRLLAPQLQRLPGEQQLAAAVLQVGEQLSQRRRPGMAL